MARSQSTLPSLRKSTKYTTAIANRKLLSVAKKYKGNRSYDMHLPSAAFKFIPSTFLMTFSNKEIDRVFPRSVDIVIPIQCAISNSRTINRQPARSIILERFPIVFLIIF